MDLESPLKCGLRAALLAVLALCMALVAFVPMIANAATYTRDSGTADEMCCADKACTQVISQHADRVRAEKACSKLTDADGITRYVRSNVFRIEAEKPTNTCGSKPAVQTREQTCPDGQIGEWTQTRDYVQAAYPTCWSPGEWLPISPPEGACVTPPPDTKAPSTPQDLAAAPTLNSVQLAWSASTDDSSVKLYQVERCTGANCSSFQVINSTDGTSFANTNLPSGMTFRYRVRAVDAAENVSEPSPVVTVTTLTPKPSGTALITWIPPTKNADGTALTNLAGYRLVYGADRDVLHDVIQIDSPSATAFTVKDLEPGTYYFAVKAFNAEGSESALSNIATKSVQ